MHEVPTIGASTIRVGMPEVSTIGVCMPEGPMIKASMTGLGGWTTAE
jgi:hypothetical protein